MKLAARSIAGARKVVKTVSEDVTVQRVNAEAGSVPALPLEENAIQMFAEIAGLVVEMVLWEKHQDAEKASVET